jgi:microcystin degradation protein MlrC
MRLAIAGILHESNTFATQPTGLDLFRVDRGEEVVTRWRDTFHEMSGLIRGGEEFGYDLYPTLMAGATPSGMVTAEAFETLAGELLERISQAPKLDGVLIALHGAMAAQGYPDADGEVLRRLRQQVGPDVPIVATHDFHANVSAQVVAACDALVIYKTNPHVDQRERGLQAAGIMARLVRGEIRPTQALVKPDMLLNILYHNTSREPLCPIMEAAANLEARPGVLAASVAGGYQYADVPEMGPSAVVVTDNDPERARQEAQRLADRLWEIREQLTLDLPDAATAVHLAMESAVSPAIRVDEGENSSGAYYRVIGRGLAPVILVDMGDNIGGGSAADSTFLLAELVRQRAQGWVCVLADPAAVQECCRAGVRQPVALEVGGKTDTLHGAPVPVRGRVRSLHDGLFEETERRHGAARHNDQGRTAVIEVERAADGPPNLLALSTRRQPPFSLRQITSLGIEPQFQSMIVVKAAIAYRAAYEPVAGRILEVDTPGLTAINPTRFTYRNVRPIWGLGR